MPVKSTFPANYAAVGSSAFGDGMDSSAAPSGLRDNQYWAAMNIVHRGGVLQTRPGFDTVFGMPCGWPQGIVLFQPTGAPMYLVVAVGGLIYVSQWQNGFNYYKVLPNIQFSPLYRNVYWAVCTQFTSYDSSGNLYNLQTPVNVLIMQDGVSRAAYWDGQNSGHIDPTPSDHSSALSPPGFDGTPQGEWMVWEGARLWVSRDNQIFASDFGNPLKFKEQTYLSNVTSFLMPGSVNGMIQPTPQSPLIVLTDTSISYLQVDIRDRTQWATTPNFQQDNYMVGGVAGRSLISSFGQAWWYACQGLTNLNYATQQTINSQFTYLDQQMALSKNFLSSNLRGICACAFENYILVSVPSSDCWNSHTWCLDQTPSSYDPRTSGTLYRGVPGWSSYWTGIRPVEWTVGVIEGVQYAFTLSYDYDGVNRVWVAFDGSRTDNGCPITSWVQTKAHNNQNLNKKRFVYTDMHLVEVYGILDMTASFGSEKGAYQNVMTKRIVATPGGLDDTTIYSSSEIIQSYKPQTRYVKTEDNSDEVSDCNMCGVESNDANYEGVEFSMLFAWSGRCALKDYRIMLRTDMDDVWTGDCNQEDEVGPRILTEQGCSSLTPDPTTSSLTTFTDADTVILDCPYGETGNPSIGLATRKSNISDDDAEKKAACAAYQDALAFLICK